MDFNKTINSIENMNKNIESKICILTAKGCKYCIYIPMKEIHNTKRIYLMPDNKTLAIKGLIEGEKDITYVISTDDIKSFEIIDECGEIFTDDIYFSILPRVMFYSINNLNYEI